MRSFGPRLCVGAATKLVDDFVDLSGSHAAAPIGFSYTSQLSSVRLSDASQCWVAIEPIDRTLDHPLCRCDLGLVDKINQAATFIGGEHGPGPLDSSRSPGPLLSFAR